jgi:glycerate dehydrogenase
MEDQTIVIAPSLNEAKRSIVKGILGKDVRVIFLADMPSGLREQTLIGATALLTWNLRKELGSSEFALLKRTELIQLVTAGADHVPFGELSPATVVACNPGAYAEPIAEHVLAMTLALEKNLVREHQKLVQGKFDQSAYNRMLRGSVCGVLGFGGIGQATARLLRCLGMRIHAVNTTGRTEEPVEFIGTLKDIRQVLSSSDVVVISLPLTRATRGLIGSRELGWMKPDAVLINVARGDIIDEGALYEHLRAHPGFKAGIDTWWIEPFSFGEFRTKYPFLTLSNVVGSPHNSAIAPGVNKEATRRAAANIMRFLRGEPLTGVVRREDYRA